jgi:hypothetical protein
MHKLHELKEMLCGELEELGGKESLSMQDLDLVDKLAHAAKNIDKLIDSAEGGHSMDGSSGRMYSNRSYDRSYDGSYDGDGSSGDYSGRRGRGSNAKRDSMGRYSGAGNMVGELKQMMQQAQDERTRREFENFIQKIETM